MPHDHIQKIKILTPSTPKSQTLGHDLGDLVKIPSNVLFLSIVRRQTKFGLKIFEIDFGGDQNSVLLHVPFI